jgi:hypothetical protein
MALEAIFTLALGLTLTWIVLSVATNAINDWISGRLLKPAKDLQHAIGSMLQDADLLRKFYDHPLIHSLAPKTRKQPIPAWFAKYPILRGFTTQKDIVPTIIPSTVFAEAMFDIFVYDSLTPEEAREELSIARIKTSIERLQSRKPHLLQILGKLFPRLDKPSILDLKIAECKANIANWYSYPTVYLAEAQRRYGESMALTIGFLLALLLNIDMIQMTIYL